MHGGNDACGDGKAAGRPDDRRRGDAGHRRAALYVEGRLSFQRGICRDPERYGREGAEGKRPLLSDLRESGAIEQDADMVMFVHRPEYYHIYQGSNGEDYRGKAEIIIAKHRKGATDIALLNFRGEYTRFENPEDNSFGGLGPLEGEIRDSNIHHESQPVGYDPFNLPLRSSPTDNVPF